MKFTLNNRFKSLIGGLFAINLMLATPLFASIQDTATVATQTEQAAVAAPADSAATAVVDSAAAPAATDSTTVAAASSSSSSSSAAAAPKEEKKIDPQVYKNLLYYVFILLIACAVVGVVFKVLSIYSLTKKVNGKYNPLANNTIQAVLLFVFLIAFLAFTYYSYAVWGSWAWREAVTEHGKDIDRMFIITTVIITIVLVLVHILLLTFSLIYRMRAKRT